ncbi:discoidin domain-containing protein [Neptunicella sp. SCSIO 80796]|uniref:discoidin domain-containing protein n=1 Tax=Neptunicella plasticusilytica TaxID=3117012 RepID=UPI003A4D6DDB
MIKKFISLAALAAFSLQATESSTEEYIGKITNVFLGKTGNVKIGVNLTEDDYISCADANWPMYFPAGESYSDSWLDFVFQAKYYGSTLRIGYTPSNENNCSIEYLAIVADDGVDSGGGSIDSMVRTGSLGNVALIYTNSLVEGSYSASNHYSDDIAAAAFDGFTFSGQINEDANSPVSRGIWLVKKETDPNTNVALDNWLQISYQNTVKISGMRIMINSKSLGLGRLPRNVIIQASNDGNNFTDMQSVQLIEAEDQGVTFNSAISLKQLRLKIVSNYGDKFIEIDELELFSE